MWANAFLSVMREETGAEFTLKKAAETAMTHQLDSLPSQPRAPVRLRCGKFNHLFWQRVLVVEQSSVTILAWSW